MILGLFPELLEVGGVQRIGRHTASVLMSFAEERGHPCRLLSLNDALGQSEISIGRSAHTIQGFGKNQLKFIATTLAEFRRACLVYIGHPNLGPLGIVMKSMRPSVRYYVATYGIDVWDSLPLIHRYALRMADAVTTISNYTAEKLKTVQKLDPGKLRLLAPALDPSFLQNIDTLSVSARPGLPGRFLLTVARLDSREQYKGVDTVIRAMPAILPLFPDIFYIVVGDGDDRLRLERLATENGVEKNVIFTGNKSSEELIPYYEACEIFVMPSSQEGFGVVFLEAMAFGKPVIGCDNGGTPEIIINGITGFLVTFGDAKALANKVTLLLRQPDLRKCMGEAGRLRVEKHYSYEHFQNNLTNLLGEHSLCKS